MADAALLVGDVGGTNARFAVATPDGGLREIQGYTVKEFETFEDALELYLSGLPKRPVEACIASAGKRHGDRITLTNGHWSLSEAVLRARFGFKKARLVNDFEAQARGAASFSPDALFEIQAGQPAPHAPRLCLGPGTGFGQALIMPGATPVVVATEGGFRLLPVRTDRDEQLYRQLEQELSQPPILEEAVSGRGLVHLFSLLTGKKQTVEPAVITETALASPGQEREAIQWFFELLATAAADACLMTGAWGGVLIGGGVVPRLTSLLDKGAFKEAFARPSLMQEQLATVPIHLITDGTAALKGAVALAQEL